jgi:hypothetical protein
MAMPSVAKPLRRQCRTFPGVSLAVLRDFKG